VALYLVTGGAGFIGSHLAEALLGQGDRVRILDNFSTGRWENLDAFRNSPWLEVVEADLRDGDAVRGAVEGVAVVFHQGALPSVPRSVKDPATSHAVNATGTLNVLIASREAGVKRVVYASSSSVYGNTRRLPKHETIRPQPLSPYAASKLAGENYCLAFWNTWGLETVSLRYFNVFGPRQRPDSPYAAVIPKFISALMDGRQPLIYGDGRQSRDFTYVANVVQANLRAARAPAAAGKVFNVACGEAHSLLELLSYLAGIVGASVTPVHEPPRAGDVRDSLADIGRAKRLLGYLPGVSFEQGLALTAQWFGMAAQADRPMAAAGRAGERAPSS